MGLARGDTLKPSKLLPNVINMDVKAIFQDKKMLLLAAAAIATAVILMRRRY